MFFISSDVVMVLDLAYVVFMWHMCGFGFCFSDPVFLGKRWSEINLMQRSVYLCVSFFFFNFHLVSPILRGIVYRSII